MRKEVNISEETVKGLKAGADKKGWSIKKYMEFVLCSQALKNHLSKSSTVKK